MRETKVHLGLAVVSILAGPGGKWVLVVRGERPPALPEQPEKRGRRRIRP
jgi:hypothetical protein